ncbi:hypothetical protein P8A21_40815 (plasmid) [Streptomyces poriferorum]|uniref:hypothetical protein n=1 Tax=Streptomyces poriferorum TaxID=2798799 RepID=UPI002740205D|nr:hypothetical protein [Streptomyces sp. Alt1]WLQ53862.1 hypothetical protein P8A21_40815 [Streptomyces sp. Alt1]
MEAWQEITPCSPREQVRETVQIHGPRIHGQEAAARLPVAARILGVAEDTA